MKIKEEYLTKMSPICRFVVGLVFTFSGFVKGIDPLGSAYKFEDYFIAFGLNFLEPLALTLAIALALAEFLIGISLILKIYLKTGIWGAFIFMIFFTPLTLVLALTNPVSDCGCFGDALVLSNWQTFWKNIILLFFVLTLFLSRRSLTTAYSPTIEWMLTGFASLFLLFISYYGLKNLPLIDFRPYHIGASIPDGMIIPDGAALDEYETTLIYEKDGVQKEFTSENFPWQDSTWKFVDQNSFLVKEGYSPPIHDFNIINREGEEITDLILNDKALTFLLISQTLENTDISALEKAGKLALLCNESGIKFYGLTASGNNEIDDLVNKADLNFEFFALDETSLKTIIRSNPGLILLKEGTIIGKWAAKNIPDPEFTNKNLLAQQLTSINKQRELWVQIGLFLFALLLISGLQQYKK